VAKGVLAIGVEEVAVAEEVVEAEGVREGNVAQTRIVSHPLPSVASGATVSPTVKMGTMEEQLDVEEEVEGAVAATAVVVAEALVGLVGGRRRGKPWRR